MKVKVISLPYIFQVLYVLCFTGPRYQVSVYRTIGPLVIIIIIIIIIIIDTEMEMETECQDISCEDRHIQKDDDDDMHVTTRTGKIPQDCVSQPNGTFIYSCLLALFFNAHYYFNIYHPMNISVK